MFFPTSKDWPTPHRALAFCLGAFVLMLVLGYALFIRPRQLSLAKKQSLIQEKTMQFNQLNMPKDPSLLEYQLQTATRLLEGAPEQGFDGLNALTEETLAYATRSFTNKIRQNYTDTLAFIYGATRLDYKDLQERIAAEFTLEANGQASHPLLMEQDETQTQPVWQMIGKLWAIQEVLDKTRKAGLTLATDQDGLKFINALPIIAYTLQDSTEGNIFLLEFPVKATLTGTLEQFLAFVESVQTPECFLPLKRLTIKTTPPPALLPGNENPVERCEFTIQCSAFMLPGVPTEPLDDQQDPQETATPKETQE